MRERKQEGERKRGREGEREGETKKEVENEREYKSINGSDGM